MPRKYLFITIHGLAISCWGKICSIMLTVVNKMISVRIADCGANKIAYIVRLAFTSENNRTFLVCVFVNTS